MKSPPGGRFRPRWRPLLYATLRTREIFSLKWSLVLRSLPLHHSFYTSVYLEVIAAPHIWKSWWRQCVFSFARAAYSVLVFRRSSCAGAVKLVCFAAAATCLFSCSFVYLCAPCYCHACLTTALRVGVKKLYTKYDIGKNFPQDFMFSTKHVLRNESHILSYTVHRVTLNTTAGA